MDSLFLLLIDAEFQADHFCIIPLESSKIPEGTKNYKSEILRRVVPKPENLFLGHK